MSNPMKNVRIEKVTLNAGTGRDQQKLERAMELIRHITGITPVKTMTDRRLAAWGLRPGLPIGCKLTLRGKQARELLTRLIGAKDNIIAESCFDHEGNISFGIAEYIDIPDIEYNPKVGIMGFQVSVTLEKPGFRVKKRRYCRAPVPRQHRISKDEAIAFMKEQYQITHGEEDDV